MEKGRGYIAILNSFASSKTGVSRLSVVSADLPEDSALTDVSWVDLDRFGVLLLLMAVGLLPTIYQSDRNQSLLKI